MGYSGGDGYRMCTGSTRRCWLPSARGRAHVLAHAAVVDALIAIAIIAMFYTSSLQLHYLLLSLVLIAAYAFVVRRCELLLHRRPVAAWALLLPIGAAVWALFLTAGIHATIAGVVWAFMVPVNASERARAMGLTMGLPIPSSITCAPFPRR